MRRVPGSGSARGVLTAVVIGASALVSACGAVHAGGGGSGSPEPSGGHASAISCSATPAAPAHSLRLGMSDNGKVLCVAKGTTVAVFLQGTETRRWAPIRTVSAALQPVANGQLMLRLGETAAFFKAVAPGVATVVSSLPSCQPAGGASPAGPGCKMGTVFHLTLVVTP